jgi:hypothetical protein
MAKVTRNQRGSATMIITVGVVLVVAITIGAGAYFMVKNQKPPEAGVEISAPLSPYDPLTAGDSNNDLKADVLNIDSGMKQDELHLKGTNAAINDTPNLIADS